MRPRSFRVLCVLVLVALTSTSLRAAAQEEVQPPDKLAWIEALSGAAELPPPIAAGPPDTARAPAEGARELRLEAVEGSQINVQAWDETYPGALAFDSFARLLLVRFPGAAQAIADALAEGMAIDTVTLELPFERADRDRNAAAPKGLGFYVAVNLKRPPRWHAAASPLRRPWVADGRLGPTWNAYVSGAGYWAKGGGLDTDADRHPREFGPVEVSHAHTLGRMDVTDVLTDAAYGATLGARLRALESNGFVLRKAEKYDYNYPYGWSDWLMQTGAHQIYVKPPALVVTLVKADRAMRVDLPPAADVEALAAELADTGAGGRPPVVLPDKARLDEIATEAIQRPEGIPDWMWTRIREVIDNAPSDYFKETFNHLTSGDPGRYRRGLQDILRQTPHGRTHHNWPDYYDFLTQYADWLPENAVYVLEEFWLGWFLPMTSAEFARRAIHYFHYYWTYEGTQNFISNSRALTVLMAEHWGDEELFRRGAYSVDLLERENYFSSGACQEHGDTYYAAISLAGVKLLERYARDALLRLKGSLMAEKFLYESELCYHPLLHARVMPASRSATKAGTFDVQHLDMQAMHTLSRKGVLLHLGEEKIGPHDAVLSVHYPSPLKSALMAPWGEEWESSIIDSKPLPQTVRFSNVMWFERAGDPSYITCHLAHHYGLASENVRGRGYRAHPVVGVYSRVPGEVTDPHQRGGVQLVARADNKGGYYNWNAPALNGFLQDRGAVMAVMNPELTGKQTTLKSLGLTATLYLGEPGRTPAVYVNGEPLKALPAVASYGDRIVIDEGASYLALTLGAPTAAHQRDVEVSLTRVDGYTVQIDSYLVKRVDGMPQDGAFAKAKGPALGPEERAALNDSALAVVLQVADVTEFPTVAEFDRYVAAGKLTLERDAAAQLVRARYANGERSLALDMDLSYLPNPDNVGRPSRLFPRMTAGGRRPYPAAGIDIDGPWAQMGSTGSLSAVGATLTTTPGQRVLLKADPLTGTYRAIQPFVEPVALELATPEGVVVRADGALGMARITVHPKTGQLRVDCAIPGPEGDVGAEWLQDWVRAGKSAQAFGYNVRRPEWFYRPGVDVRTARADSSRHLLVRGMKDLRVVVNGRPPAEPPEQVERDGRTWTRVRIAP